MTAAAISLQFQNIDAMHQLFSILLDHINVSSLSGCGASVEQVREEYFLLNVTEIPEREKISYTEEIPGLSKAKWMICLTCWTCWNKKSSDHFQSISARCQQQQRTRMDPKETLVEYTQTALFVTKNNSKVRSQYHLNCNVIAKTVHWTELGGICTEKNAICNKIIIDFWKRSILQWWRQLLYLLLSIFIVFIT